MFPWLILFRLSLFNLMLLRVIIWFFCSTALYSKDAKQYFPFAFCWSFLTANFILSLVSLFCFFSFKHFLSNATLELQHNHVSLLTLFWMFHHNCHKLTGHFYNLISSAPFTLLLFCKQRHSCKTKYKKNVVFGIWGDDLVCYRRSKLLYSHLRYSWSKTPTSYFVSEGLLV